MPKLGAPYLQLLMPVSSIVSRSSGTITEISHEHAHTFDSRLAKIADLANALARSSWVWSTVIKNKFQAKATYDCWPKQGS
jgi:hypothetical protein